VGHRRGLRAAPELQRCSGNTGLSEPPLPGGNQRSAVQAVSVRLRLRVRASSSISRLQRATTKDSHVHPARDPRNRVRMEAGIGTGDR
jgi:hypothetical protein